MPISHQVLIALNQLGDTRLAGLRSIAACVIAVIKSGTRSRLVRQSNQRRATMRDRLLDHSACARSLLFDSLMADSQKYITLIRLPDGRCSVSERVNPILIISSRCPLARSVPAALKGNRVPFCLGTRFPVRDECLYSER